MKRYRFFTLTLLLSFSFLFIMQVDAINIPIGSEAPDFNLTSLNGESVKIEDFQDKILVLLYWNPEQERSFLAVEDWIDMFGSYREKGISFISIIPEPEDYKAVRKMIEDKEIEFPVFIDKGMKVFGSYEVRAYPSTVFINKKGKIAYDLPGHPLVYKSRTEGYMMYMLGEIGQKALNEMVSPSNKAIHISADKADNKYNMALR